MMNRFQSLLSMGPTDCAPNIQAAIHPTTDFLMPLPPPTGSPGGGDANGGSAGGGVGFGGGGTALEMLGELTLECLGAGALNADAEAGSRHRSPHIIRLTSISINDGLSSVDDR